MAWIESHQKLKEDPKAAAVAASMSWSLHECIGRLHCVWWWCVDHCEDGDLSRYNDAVIASAAGVAAPDAKRFVDAMVVGCGTPESPDGFFERKPKFRLRNWWKFTRRFMQKRFERQPEKWQAIAKAYGSKEAEPSADPTAGSTADPYQPEPTLKARGGGEGTEGGRRNRTKPVHTGRFPLPEFSKLPSPLYEKTAKAMLQAVDEQVKAIRATASRIHVKGKTDAGTECIIDSRLEVEAEAAIAQWETRKRQIKKALAG